MARRIDNDRQDRLAGHIGRGLLLSFFVHGSALAPLLALVIIFGRREEAARQDEVEVRFEEVSEADLPRDLVPSLESEPARPQPPRKRAPRLAEQPLPEPEVVVPPPEEMPKLPAPQPEPKQNRKMVDLDMGKEVEPPPDAKYLAQKNNRAEEETRARDTNLEREQKGVEGSEASDRQDQQLGAKDQKIAELEDQKSKLGRKAPLTTPREEQETPRSPADDERRKSLLAMREPTDKRHQVTPETVDPSLPPERDGMRPFREKGLKSMEDFEARSGAGKEVRLRLSAQQFEYVFGEDAEAIERLAQKERSRKQGRFSQRLGRVQSALENFIPEVRPGNQTALNTRAAPFAAFIARMHRSIHKLWGFGFLEDLDGKPASSPYNDPNLMTKLEMVLNGDGTVNKVTVVRTSGYMPFDAAAIDVAYSAGPYPEPPREIRSGNGKIYVHWSFHRDERQCATSGVDYYILDNAPAGRDKGEVAEPHDHGGGEAADPHEHGLPSARPPALKRLARAAPADTPARRAKMRELDEAAGGPEEPDAEAARRAAAQVVRADDPAARASAELWFDALRKGDTRRMMAQVALPFRSAGGLLIRGARDLEGMFRSLVDELPGAREVRALQLYSPAGARGALGTLPPGFEDGPTLLFASAHVAGAQLVLVLAPTKGQWRAVGLVRR